MCATTLAVKQHYTQLLDTAGSPTCFRSSLIYRAFARAPAGCDSLSIRFLLQLYPISTDTYSLQQNHHSHCAETSSKPSNPDMPSRATMDSVQHFSGNNTEGYISALATRAFATCALQS